MADPKWEDTKPVEASEPKWEDTSDLDAGIPQSQSVIEGLIKGLTVGTKPILAGATKTGLDVLSGTASPKEILERYRHYRDLEKQSEKEAEEANPKTFAGAEIVGSLAPMAVMPEMSAAKAGALFGGLGGLTQGEGDLTKGEYGQVAKDVAGGTLSGAALGKVLGVIGDRLSPSTLERKAGERAIKAGGATAGERKALMQAPIAGAEEIAEAKAAVKAGNATQEQIDIAHQSLPTRLQEHGKLLLEKNPYTETPIVTPMSRPEHILERSQELQQKAGEDIGNLLGKLDGKFSEENPEIRNSFFNPESVIDKVKELQKKYVKNERILPSFKTQYRELEDIIRTIQEFGNKPIDFAEAQKLKQLVTDKAYDDSGKLTNELMGKVRAIVNDGIEEAADVVTKKTNDPNLVNAYLKAKDLYRVAKDQIRMSTGQVAREMGHRDLGITDFMAGGAATLAHGTPTGVITVGAKKLADAYGNSLAATAQKKTADVFRGVNKAFTKAPAALKSVGDELVKSDDVIRRSLGRMLVEASEKDDIGRNALIFSLQQNPKYRELMKDIVQKKDENE